MLDPRSFEKHTANLKLGGRLRTNHDCGPGRTLLLSRNEDGVSAYCFRCGEPGFIKDERTLQERIAALAKVREADAVATTPELPQPRITNVQLWPKEYRVWLYKAGLSNDQIERLGFYWHEPTQRVVMPVFDADGLTYWQARSMNKYVAKYLNSPSGRAGVIPKYGVRTELPLVLTEDILSAVKVGMVTEAWSIMGTSIPDTLLLAIVEDGRDVILMLDPDEAGQAGNRKAKNKLDLLGVNTTIIQPEKDPKLLGRENLCTLLASSYNTALKGNSKCAIQSSSLL